MNRGDFVVKILILWMSTAALAGPAVGAPGQQQSPLVLVEISRGLRVSTPFVIRVKNDLAVPITFCTDFGKNVQAQSGQQVAANPFETQRWTGTRWDTQLTGTDAGSINTAISIDAHESKSFVLQINASGRYRLRLVYLKGEIDSQCPLPSDHSLMTSSMPFLIPAPAKK
jgi:hypothetical protein